jgi:hypothetical protein
MKHQEITEFLDKLLARVESGQCSTNFALTIAFMRGLQEGNKLLLQDVPPNDDRVVGVALDHDGDLRFGNARYRNGVWMTEDGSTPLPSKPKHWTELA